MRNIEKENRREKLFQIFNLSFAIRKNLTRIVGDREFRWDTGKTFSYCHGKRETPAKRETTKQGDDYKCIPHT